MQKKVSNQKLNKILLLLIGIIVLAVIGIALRKNIHVVVPNQVYRSAQLSSNALSVLVKDKKIQSIINLRGKNTNQHWYQQEMKTSQLLGIPHYDVALNAKQLPKKSQLQQLVNLIQTAPKPLLIHCESGSDRTGLASAIALIVLKNKTLAQAKQAFSWRYYVTASNSIGKLVFQRYENWLQEKHQKPSKQRFLAWVMTVYSLSVKNTQKR